MKNTLIKNYIEKNYKDWFKKYVEFDKSFDCYITTKMIYLWINNGIIYEDIQDLQINNGLIEFKTNNYNSALNQFRKLIIESNQYKK